MLCKATEADLEQMGLRSAAKRMAEPARMLWTGFVELVGLDNILILARDPAPGAKPIPGRHDWCGSSGMRAPPRRMALLHGNGTRPCRGAG